MRMTAQHPEAQSADAAAPEPLFDLSDWSQRCVLAGLNAYVLNGNTVCLQKCDWALSSSQPAMQRPLEVTKYQALASLLCVAVIPVFNLTAHKLSQQADIHVCLHHAGTGLQPMSRSRLGTG